MGLNISSPFHYICSKKADMRLISRFTIIFILLLFKINVCFPNNLEKELLLLTKNLNATVGVAVIKGDQTIALLNNHVHYPLMSVFKFHVAVAVLHKMAEQKRQLEDSLLIQPEEFRENTYSPLRNVLHPQKPFKLPFSTLLYYNIALSDNNACDILIRYLGGIDKVQQLMGNIGITGLQLTETENDMHENLLNCYKNWSTPLSVAQCMKTIYEGNVLQGKYKQFLFDTMLATTTGSEKIKAGLPAGIAFAHKTGSSDRLPSGTMIGDNDAGIVNPARTNQYYIVIFIKDSDASSLAHATLFQRVSKAVYRYIRKEYR